MHIKPGVRLSSVKLAKISMLIALASFCANIQILVIPSAPFLKYSPDQIPVLIGGFLFGVRASIAIGGCSAGIASLLFGHGGLIGFIMNFISLVCMGGVSSLFYEKEKSRKSALIGLSLAVIATSLIMTWVCYRFVLPMMKLPLSYATTYILPFNLVKCAINSLLTFIFYKKLSKVLK